MIRGLVIREAESKDHLAIAKLVEAAFGRPAEARLVEKLREDGDMVLELVATNAGELVGHIAFSRLDIAVEPDHFDALALAPMAVAPDRQGSGVGKSLLENAHHMLEERGERLCVVLDDPAYYGRFGYTHDRASKFESDYQGPALQALAWGEAPQKGRLTHPGAFSEL